MILIFSAILLLFPFISNYLFEHRANSLISTYEAETEQAEDSVLSALRDEAARYNEKLLESHIQLTDPFESVEKFVDAGEYSAMLKVGDSDVMAYIDIPKIDVYLPVYHGTDAATLEKGVGHLEGSSLPVGGAGTHCVLSGHTGINRAKIFTDLSELELGDHFFLHTLGETLAYEVDQILVVEPDDISALQICVGEDYVTLVTCTPYGVNSHRLLVRGVRTDYAPEAAEQVRQEEQESADTSSRWMREYEKALVAGVGLVVLLRLTMLLAQKRREHSENR